MVNYTPKTAKDSKNPPKEDTVVFVKELTSKAFVLLKPEDSIIDAQEKLLEQKLPGSPVVDEDNLPIGFLSEKDCLLRIMQMKYYNDMSEKVKDFMSKTCFTIGKNEHIIKAVETFSKHSFNILPVINNQRKVIGILNRQDVFRYMVKIKQQNW